MPGSKSFPAAVLVTLALTLPCGPARAAETASRGAAWTMHVIDDSSRGADGVRLADVNGDGLLDLTTGWEEGGITRVYLHPGHPRAAQRWPAVTVGRTPSVEDAVLADLDADGQVDVVSCCEGRTRTIFVHWAPKNPQSYLDPGQWKSEPIPASAGVTAWMFSIPSQVDGRRGIDLVAGAKGGGAQIGWFQSPENPRRLEDWRWHPISPAGWIMSLACVDFDSDGDLDVLASDRRGQLRGCRWLENPGPGPRQSQPWRNHFLGGRDREVMFLTFADLDSDGSREVLAAVKGGGLLLLRRSSDHSGNWKSSSIALPENVGTDKGVAVGDVDRDGRADVVFSCEGAGGEKSGVVWLALDANFAKKGCTPHEISGPAGIKFDRLELLDVDVDGDGDLDVLACEESQPASGARRGLGVIWYENPTLGR